MRGRPQRGSPKAPPGGAPAGAPARPRRVSWAWPALVLVVLAAGLVRARMLDFPLERDEGEYAYMGQLILDGVPPYREAGNHKFPGTYYAYAAAMAVFGETARGVHLGLLLVNCGSIALVFLLGRRLFGDLAGIVGAAAFALLAVGVGVVGFAAHMTHFVVLPVLAGLVLLLRAIDSGRTLPLAAAGVALGLAVVVRQTSLVFLAFAAVYWLIAVRRTLDASSLMRRALAFAGGAAAPIAIMLISLAAAGVFRQFWLWTVTQALAYGGQMSVAAGLRDGIANARAVVGSNIGLWLAALAGLALLARERSARFWFVAGLLAAGAAATGAGLYFRPHYFVQVLPPVALLCGHAVAVLWERSGRRGTPAAARVALGGAVLLTFAYPLAAQADVLFELSPDAAIRRVYGRNPFPESIEIGRYIREHSSPGDTVAVLGSEPQIYFYSDRRSATSFLYVYPLLERHPRARSMQAAMIREIEAAAPLYLVITQVPQSWGLRPESDRTIIQWANRYVGAHYRPVGVAEIGRSGTSYYWGEAAAEHLPGGATVVPAVVYRRSAGGAAGAGAGASPP